MGENTAGQREEHAPDWPARGGVEEARVAQPTGMNPFGLTREWRPPGGADSRRKSSDDPSGHPEGWRGPLSRGIRDLVARRRIVGEGIEFPFGWAQPEAADDMEGGGPKTRETMDPKVMRCTVQARSQSIRD